MKRIAVIVVALMFLATGCYTGRTPARKQANYILNGAAIAVGASLLLASAIDDDDCEGEGCVSQGLAAGAMGVAALSLVGIGVVGVGISAIVPTKYPEPAPDAPTTTAQVHGPGLRPATITVH